MKSLLGLIVAISFLTTNSVMAHENYATLMKFVNSQKRVFKFPHKHKHHNFPYHPAQIQASKKGLKIPIMEAKEGDVLAFDGERWVPSDLSDMIGEGLAGPMGPQGLQGEQGIQGLTGDKGDQGIQGIPGVGIQGAQGVAGIKGDVGAMGPQGVVGIKGDAGTVGPSGADGMAGAKGDKGDAGAMGPQGLMGLMGLDGLPGAKGDKGDKGDAGALGPQGLMGLMGLDGLPGAKGDKGDKGDAGALGPMGIQGLAGLAGERGEKGDKGDKGDAGRDANLFAGTNPGDMVQLDQEGRIPASVMPVVAASTANEIKVAFLKDVKDPGMGGGDAPALQWIVRELNEVSGDASIVSLNNNRVTLQAGTYLIEAKLPAYVTNYSKAKLVNTTTQETMILGTRTRNSSSAPVDAYCFIDGQIILIETTTIELQQAFHTERQGIGLGMALTSALGVPAGFGEKEVYSVLKITKLK